MARTVSRRRGSRRTEPEDLEDQETTRDDDDNDEEDEAPRRGRRSRNSGSGGRSSGRSRSSDDDDEGDEDESPRRGRRSSGGSTNVVKSGWDGYDSIADGGGGEFADKLEVTDEAKLIKILDAAPAASWSQHWIERGPGKKKSFACIGDGCPLCDRIGDKPRKQAIFNVVEFDEDGNPSLKVWQVGPMVGNILKNLGKDKKTGPLDREDLYYSVSKDYNKKTKKTTYTVNATKERDVVEDWEIDPLDEDELAEFLDKAVGDEYVQVQTKRELKDVANEAMDDADDD
jgi:hypothetical protein